MALFSNPAEHATNPPNTWQVVKVGKRWHLRTAHGTMINGYPRRKDAEAACKSGYLVDLYNKEARWYRSETVQGWRPYSEVAPIEPTLTNSQRVKHAHTALRAFAAMFNPVEYDVSDLTNGGEFLSVAGDLVADLMHAAVAAGIDPNRLIERAELHFTEESTAEIV